MQAPIGPLFLAAMGALLIPGSVMLLYHGNVAPVFSVCSALVAYIYVGYPLILQTLRPLLSKPIRKAEIEPRVSVLIAANDEEAVIEAKILNTLALAYPADRLEIVVVSDGSVDGTNGIVRRYAPYGVRLVEISPRRGKMVALNLGMTVVTGDIVVFSDANTFLEPDAVSALVRSFADEHVGAVSGDVTLVGERAALGFSEDLYYWYERWIQRAESEIGSMVGTDGALYAVRRTLYVPPPDDTVLDDMAVPMGVIRSGHRVVFEPDARAHEEGSSTAREEFARKSRVIAGAVQFLMRHDSNVPVRAVQVAVSLVSHKGLRWMSPIFGLGAFLCSLSLAPTSYGYAMAAAGQGLLFALGAAGCSPRLRRPAVVAVAHYFCLVQAAAMLGFVRGISGRQSVQWRRFARAGNVSPAEAHQ
jgi:cellulose synthase/poly-beta-1,6-N-acetylglucosamine synthase-like glycosyltransferase